MRGQNLSVSADALPPPLPRGGFGSPRKVNGFARGSPTRGNGDDCSGADRCQRQMKGGEARAAFCFFKVPAKGLKKKQQTQPERQRRKQGVAVGAAASRMQATAHSTINKQKRR